MKLVSRELLEKYDRPGPRYTSYPTAAQFHPGVGEKDYLAALRGARPGGALSIYVHVPFCEQRCTYCGCYAIPTRRKSIAAEYLGYCSRELSLVRACLASPARVAAVHLGGGTPTYLSPGQIEDLIGTLRRTFEVEPGAEISVELDPRVTTEHHLDALGRAGANRLSLGVQDTSVEVQEAIGRFQTREQSLSFLRLCRARGFQSINVDLVYGLPRQTPERFRSTLRDVLSVRPDRFAVFGYAHVPWMKHNQRRIEVADLPGAEARLELYEMAHEELTGAGYRHIGMDHFALPGDDLSVAQGEGRLGRNFMGYTPRRELQILGIGVSSIGNVGSGYFQNEKKLSRYFDRLDRGELPIERGCLCSEDDFARRHVIHEILCNLRVRFEDFTSRFGARFGEYFAREMGDLKELERDGLIELDAEGLRVCGAGSLLLRNIAMPFDRYLREAPPARATFSRTV